METQDRSSFEDSWRRALDGAEVIPDPQIWDNIQQRLDNPGRKAKHIFLIKFAIAASFLFAMTTAGLYMYQGRQNITDLNSGIATHNNDNKIIGSGEVLSPEKEIVQATPEDSHRNLEQVKGATALASGPTPSLWQDVLEAGETSWMKLGDQASGFLERLNVSLFESKEPELATMRNVPVLSVFPRTENGAGWASMNFAGGGMNVTSAGGVSSFGVADSENLSNSTFVSRTNTENPESSILVGIGFGKSLSRRWVFQGGANYTVRKASGTSNIITSNNSVAVALKNAVAQTESYNIEHRLAYISVPVQVGYKVVDRKVNLTLLAGIAGDMRVSHRITDQEGELNSIRLREESNFKNYAASAIVSAEVSYPLGHHYRISAYPQVRQYLSPLQEGGELPVSLEMGVRLSYMF